MSFKAVIASHSAWLDLIFAAYHRLERVGERLSSRDKLHIARLVVMGSDCLFIVDTGSSVQWSVHAT